jgi:hypothetical protein
MIVALIILVIFIFIILVAVELDKNKKYEAEDGKKNKSNLRCPVCNERMGIYDLSNAKFNHMIICKKCTIKIQEKFGEKRLNNIYLEDLQEAVLEYDLKKKIDIDENGTIYDTETGEIIKK